MCLFIFFKSTKKRHGNQIHVAKYEKTKTLIDSVGTGNSHSSKNANVQVASGPTEARLPYKSYRDCFCFCMLMDSKGAPRSSTHR